MCFKGNVVFGGRTVATWVLGGVARDSSDGWEVEKGILLCLDELEGEWRDDWRVRWLDLQTVRYT